MKKIIFLSLCLFIAGCSSQRILKMNGVSFVASREQALQEHVDALLRVHADCAAVMPYGFIRDVWEPEIIFDTQRQWYGETREGARQYIELLHANGLKVMLKPQLWIRGGTFTGTMDMSTEVQWQVLEDAYERFILNYAQLAQETQVELLCIGTELGVFIKRRPQYWQSLIGKIKGTYNGKLTYAANWDEYQQTPFWPQLDYIGIDAYFPLSDEKTPDVETLRKAWQPWKESISAFAGKVKRRVLFTEFGYRSTDFTAHRPWQADRDEAGVNLEGQVNAKKALFEEFWKEPWFTGGFVWKWFINHTSSGGAEDNRFTPQNKPAEEVIKAFYSAY